MKNARIFIIVGVILVFIIALAFIISQQQNRQMMAIFTEKVQKPEAEKGLITGLLDKIL